MDYLDEPVKPKKGPKRTPFQREKDLNTLARLYASDVSQTEIARKLGISQSQVCWDIKVLLERWEKENFSNVTRYKNEYIERLKRIEEELWIQWENSKSLPKQRRSVTFNANYKKGKTADEDPQFESRTLTEEDARGDMQYMNGIFWCMQERAKTWGVYAPKKMAQTDPSGEKEAGRDSYEELFGMISDFADKMRKKQEEDSKPVIDVNPDTGEPIDGSGVPIYKLLNEEQIRRLPAPVAPTVTNNVAPHELEASISEDSELDDEELISRVQKVIGT